MPLRRRLLNILSDGEFHSGEALGAALGVSRMAVWKHLKVLRETGVDFEVIRGRGYRFPATTELLDREVILSATDAASKHCLGEIEVLLDIDSTNNRLREQALQGAPSGTVCLAEMQHAGRGRRGREWVSPFAANLYLSLLWRSAAGAAALGGLSLVVGIALIRCLQSFGINTAGMKWPNDVVVNGAKLAGILIDVVGETSGPCAVIIGVGINVAMPQTAAAGIGQSWTDMKTVTGCGTISRNQLAARLLDNMLPVITRFESDGLQPFLDEWDRFDSVKGCQINLQLAGETVSGKACGVDAGGALLVETSGGRQRFASGEVSLRVAS
jgi:BirA family biotin operon repressor/biotin-[acetyl-CoA-carboxylase] ligase